MIRKMGGTMLLLSFLGGEKKTAWQLGRRRCTGNSSECHRDFADSHVLAGKEERRVRAGTLLVVPSAAGVQRPVPRLCKTSL